MIIHDENSKKAKTKSASRLRRWSKRHRVLLRLATLCAVFLMGMQAQTMTAIKQLRAELGLTGGNWAFVKSILREPNIALDVLLHEDLPTLTIDMRFDNFEKILTKRKEALRIGLLLTSDDDFVPAEIRFQERIVDVKMRLKGDLTDHFGTDKWSYRIHVKGDDQLFGMRRFSIQHPQTRKFLLEWGWLENLRLDGILAPRYRFVKVVFNGTPKGIYALEEHFSKELLESQERREGVIITFDESIYWQRYAQLGHAPAWYDFVANLNDYRNALIETSRPSRVANDSTLSNERDAALGLLRAFQKRELTASEVFDASLLGRFLAISELWQTYHALYWNNIHFYYNPITAKLEPIGFDGTADPFPTLELYALNEPWLIQALEDPKVAEVYVKELHRISQPEYLEHIRAQLDDPLSQLQLALYREFPFVRSMPVWEVLSARQGYIQRSLDATHTVLAFANRDSSGSGSALGSAIEVDVQNILTLPVEILGFRAGDSFIPAREVWVGPAGYDYARDGYNSTILSGGERARAEPLRYSVFRIPVGAVHAQVNDGQMHELEVVTRILGMSATHTSPVHAYPSVLTADFMPSMPTVQQVLKNHPFLERGEAEDSLVVRPGDWNVTGDLVLPQGIRLQAGPGTALHFARDAIFVATGSLEFHGSAEAPVVLSPQELSWGGVVVMGAESPSVWENVIVKETHGIERGGWILTGGITFYESPIHLSHSRILGSEAEDGINVVRSFFEFRDCEFGELASDAFDGDFTLGAIQNCGFHDVQGDAIDVSGSEISVGDIVLRNIGDKGISAGEASQVDAADLLVTNVGIAVASKDLSHVDLQHVAIERALIAGLAAYEKKQEYGPARITALDIEFSEVAQQTLVQTDSKIHLDNQRVEGSEKDEEVLFEAGILGN